MPTQGRSLKWLSASSRKTLKRLRLVTLNGVASVRAGINDSAQHELR